MHDIKEIRQNPTRFKEFLLRRGIEADIDKILQLDQKWRDITNNLDKMRAQRNAVSKQIGLAKKAQIDTSQFEVEMRNLGDTIQKGEIEIRQLLDEINRLLSLLPNLPAEDTPIGKNSDDNVIVRQCGDVSKSDFIPLEHLDFAEKIGILDFRRGGKITGSGFPVWTGEGAQLERAIINFMLDLHTKEHNYNEMLTPFIANRDSMYGSGQIPHLEDDMYHIELDDLFLIPTSEVTLVNLHRGEIFPEEVLPIKYCAYSPCFRREAGAYGASTRGFLRTHQFNKVELVRFERPEDSFNALEELVSNAETVLKRLELPYRVVRLCTGDMGFCAAACYDIEVWAPATKRWLEVSSCSNCTDFQARRADIKFRSKSTGKTDYVHTLNGSGVATSRLMVAILENYQTDEGVLAVPSVLRNYMGGKMLIRGVIKKR